MRMLVLAAAAALAGGAHAAAPKAVTPGTQEVATAPQAGAPPPGSAEAAPTGQVTPPTTAAAPAPVKVQDPTLDRNGAPLLVATPGIGQPTDRAIDLQEQVTPNGREAKAFHNNILMWVIIGVSLLVLFLLGYVVIRFRESANPVPSKTSHNTMIEIVWTAAPVLILAAIAVPSIGLLARQFKPAPDNAVTIKAIGNQWFWSYEYPDYGGVSVTANMLKEKNEVAAGQRYRTDADGPRLLAVDNRIVLPVGVPIRLITTATDVIHSWAMPAFWIKLDAVPGRLNETSFTIEKPGLYFGQCSELCGARHAYMPIAVEAVPVAQFNRWIQAKGGTLPGAKEAAAPTNAVIPQPGADAADATSNASNAADVPVVNATEAASPSTQRATGNGGGVGNVDQ
ncbi:cytochrome C oxidase subunit II [Sphingomonas sp. Leaf23]|uniref:cytochrome c oxidase subunit II n=1 Tax=Sphingomonas sp. Leaf23 TaxID=1735689 RepID=UPI0006FF2D0C|nr:cytochrome c oxidase subunit II [Sphingomonas sp. Leaf23]KQM85520.1 cytochrome C oxidase subunit II [Sphingomonas sp. Leaf23]